MECRVAGVTDRWLAEGLVLIFAKWERNAQEERHPAGRAGTALGYEEAVTLLPRLSQIRIDLGKSSSADVTGDEDIRAFRRLWQEWRDDRRLERLGRALLHP